MLINDDRTFKRSLDEQTAVQQRLHLNALDRALAKHEEVRESAERARERVELEIERERCRRAEEERKAVERARRELEEQRLEEQRREVEAERVREETRRRQEAVKKEQEDARRNSEAQRQREEQEKAVTARRDKEEADRKARQDAEAKQREAQAQSERQQQSSPLARPNGIASVPRPTPTPSQPAPTSQPVQPPSNLPQGLVSSTDERSSIHRQYLHLHKRLKQMRLDVLNETKKVTGLKNQLSDWRRAIAKCCGQLSKSGGEEAKQSNRRAMQEIIQHLDAATQVSELSIDVTQYLVENRQPPDANKQGPACLVFLLNHFAKNIINQFLRESAVDAKTADAIGVLAVTIFARPQYLFNGQSLIDVLWAKYHKTAPILFGINGNEATKEGRARLGWKLDQGAFVSEQEHYDRTSGLGAGFAAITLRDFSKSKNSNPAPNRIYWICLARILNTPANETQPTHFVVLKAMIDNYVPRILSLFGGAGLAVLRQALMYVPNEKAKTSVNGKAAPAVTALQAMAMILQRDLDLTL